jgi:hypothetical protein
VKLRERVLAYRPSAAMIVALIALFVALGGTTYAVRGLPRKSVGSAQLKRNAVRTQNIKARNVTKSRIARGAVDSSIVASNSLTGNNIRESTLGTVPKANNAVNAENAAKVGGRTVQKFSFVAPAGTGPTVALSLNGLILTATCAAGPALTVAGTTTINDSLVHAHVRQSGATHYLADDNFDVGNNFNPLPPTTTDVIGDLVFARQDGEVVTATYLAQETATGCVFAGTAIG